MREGLVAKSVILMRHGESEANASGTWQGTGSSPLTAMGRRQAERAGTRLVARPIALVESSDLQRCIDTALAAGFVPESRPAWREGDVGEWEGRDRQYVNTRFARELERLHYDYDMPVGVTGESPRRVGERASEALYGLVDRMHEGQTALVVTHAGLIGALLRRLLDLPPDRRRIGVVANTALCELTFRTGGAAIRTFNDATHLGSATGWAAGMRREGATAVGLIRHGNSHAGRERTDQNRGDGLDSKGRVQAGMLRGAVGDVAEVYSSPRARAMDTAKIAFGRSPVPVPELTEIDLGEWNGDLWPDVEVGNHSGETWSEVQRRSSSFLEGLVSIHRGQRVAVVSHGGVIRACAGSVLGFGLQKAGLLMSAENASVTRVVVRADGKPVLATYNVTGHIEG